jgi:hypothetical protein
LGVVQECVSASDEVSQAVERSVKPVLRELGRRRGLQQETTKKLEVIMDEAVTAIKHVVANLHQFDVQPHAHPDEDPIFLQLDNIIDGKIGPPLPPSHMPAIEKEGLRRLTNKIPPGYKDKHKDDPQALGDYMLWEQILLEATERRVPVLFVTRDAKEDWVWREHGRTRGPRVELVEEMANRAGQPFHLIDVTSFLRHAATYLSAKISSTTLEQADNLSSANHPNKIAVRVFAGSPVQSRQLRHRLSEILSREQITASTATVKVLAEFLLRMSEGGTSPDDVLLFLRSAIRLPNPRKDEVIADAAERMAIHADSGEREFEFAQALLVLLNGNTSPDEAEDSGISDI